VTFQLPHIISWAHRLAEEILNHGDLAVDLTAGRGRDTLHLAKMVGPSGCVVAFDIQQQAITETRQLLTQEDIASDVLERPLTGAFPPGVFLVQGDHANLHSYVSTSPRVVMANLGYLPGGDHGVTTTPESTVVALKTSLEILAPGGRLVCVLYTGHPGGTDEAGAVEALFTKLTSRDWFVLRFQVANRKQAPYLLVAEKR